MSHRVGNRSTARLGTVLLGEAIEALERLWKRRSESLEEEGSMRSNSPSSVLIVAHQTADSPELVEAVDQRASEGPCTFTLLVPKRPHGLHRVVDPEDHGSAEAFARLDIAVPLLSEAAGQPIVKRRRHVP